jgi:hypothetical protein
MLNNDLYKNTNYHRNSFNIAHNEQGEKIIYSSDVAIIVKSTTDSLSTLSIEKRANGSNYDKAIERAKNIVYNYTFKDNTLTLDSYFTTDIENKYSDQEIQLTLYLPESSVLKCHTNSSSFFYHKNYHGTIVSYKDSNHYLKILEDNIECLDCPESSSSFDVDLHDETSGLKINEEGVEIKSNDVNIKVDGDGLKSESEEVKVNIDSDGVEIKSKDD